MRVVRILVFLAAFFCAGTVFAQDTGQAVPPEDTVQCAEQDRVILCNLTIPNYVRRIRSVLANGWENSITIHISLLSGDGSKTIRKSRLEATERCYLDPFESPCLVLWRGAATWQRYRDEAALVKALSHFGVQAISLDDLPADNYMIRVRIQVAASAQKRLQSLRSWFKQGDSDAGFWSTNSLIGALLTSQAEAVEGHSLETTIETSQFYIDLAFSDAEEAADAEPPTEDALSEDAPADGLE
ncbi:MAG: hypothetical protein II767_03535 [Proteobacteria bacterium]|nr:hypothetical protein [Pseudomonadota bacterium]